MLKKLDMLVSICLAVLMVPVIAFAIKDLLRDRSPHAVYEGEFKIEYVNPPCKNSREEPIEFWPHQHGEFADYKISGLTLISDDRNIHFDIDGYLGMPVEYRDFILRAACARSILGDVDNPGRASPPAEVVLAADCLAVKRLRDEQKYSREQIAVIAEQIARVKSVSQTDTDTRTGDLYACYDAPK